MCSKGCWLQNLYQEQSEKKLHIQESPKNKFETVLNENVIFDEFEETITEEYKEYIDIASDKVVMKKLSEAGLLYYFYIILCCSSSLSWQENTLCQTLP